MMKGHEISISKDQEISQRWHRGLSSLSDKKGNSNGSDYLRATQALWLFQLRGRSDHGWSHGRSLAHLDLHPRDAQPLVQTLKGNK